MRFDEMEGESSYEVIFALNSLAFAGSRETFRWSWVKLRADGAVTVHGKVYDSLRDALDAASDYRRDHGGGRIRVNIQETHHRDAQDAVYLG